MDPTVYEDTETVDTKSLTQTSLGILAEGAAPTISVTIANRRNKPYPPADVKIGAVSFPATVGDITINVTWSHQDRTQQLDVGGTDWFDTALGSPESGVLYEVRYYDDDLTTLLFTDTAISGSASAFKPASAVGVPINIRVEIDSSRAGFTNLVTYSHVFAFTKELGVRTLENADTRTLENGDRRVLEG